MKLIRNVNPLVAGLFAVLLLTSAPSACHAENLYSVVITGKIAFQETKNQNVNCHKQGGSNVCDKVEINTITTAPINNRSLLNLITGRSPLGVPPPNLVLGITFGCESEGHGQLVVYDKAASNVVVVVADVSTSELMYSNKVVCTGTGTNRECHVVNSGFQGFLQLLLRTIGNPETNSINGGEINLYVKGSLTTNGCMFAVSGSGFGEGEATVEGDELDVLVPNFTLTSGKKIAVLPPPIQTLVQSPPPLVVLGGQRIRQEELPRTPGL